MDHKKRRITDSDEEGKDLGHAKRQKTDETEYEKELSKPFYVNVVSNQTADHRIEETTFDNSTCNDITQNSTEPPEKVDRQDKLKGIDKETYTHGTFDLSAENVGSDMLIECIHEEAIHGTFEDAGQYKPTYNNTERFSHDSSELPVDDLTPEKLKDIFSEENVKRRTEILGEDEEADKLRESIPEEAIRESTEIHEEVIESEPLKETNSREVTHDNTSLRMENVEPERLQEILRQDIIHDTSGRLVEEAATLTEIVNEEVTHYTTLIAVDDVENERLKETTSKDVTYDSAMIPVDDVKQEILKEVCREDDRTEVPMIDDDSKTLKEICHEGLTHDSNVTPGEKTEPHQLKETTNEDVACDSTEVSVVEFKDRIEGEIDEKHNNKVSSPITSEISAVEESKLDQQNEKTTEITDSTLQNSEDAQQSTPSDESTKNESQNAGR